MHRSGITETDCAEQAGAAPRAALTLRLLACVQLWLHNSRTRRQLAQLDGRQLADVGITQAERESELDKPFWR
jgi:uncharacterized protein YjiS (DUF1127 family)